MFLAGACAAAHAAGNLAPDLQALRTMEARPSTAGPADPHSLILRGGVVSTKAQTARLSSLMVLDDVAANAPRHFVIQLDGPMTPARRTALEGAGIVVGEYLPTNAYVATFAPGARAAAVDALQFVRWSAPFQASWKLDPTIGDYPVSTPARVALEAEGKVMVAAYLFPGADTDAAVAAIRSIAGATATDTGDLGGNRALSVTIPAEKVEALAAIDAVQFVEETPEFTDRNQTSRSVVQSGFGGTVAAFTPLYNNGLTGLGQIGGHMDSGISTTHCSFRDPEGDPFGPNHRKILAYNGGGGAATHGTHTAGTFVGDAGDITDTRGVAYDAKLVWSSSSLGDQSTGTIFLSRLNTHHSQGARVHTNSWGADFTTTYNGWSRTIDLYSRANETGMVAFAITNQNNLYTPENAKSCMSVGGSQDAPNVNSFCTGGRGPTADGRFKPEVYAPGCSTRSAIPSTCSISSLTGTSMACPAVAGAALLIRQYYTDGYYPSGAANASDGFEPSGALLRATLMNSSVDMTSVFEASTIGGPGSVGYPNNREGWGRLVADNGLFFPGDGRKMVVRDVRNASAESLSTGGVWEMEFDVNSSSEQLRVTMTFTDLAATLNAAFTPVNNIDLEVVSPGGTVYLGNRFTGGVTVTGGVADAINSTEQVHLNTPGVGTWLVRVKGTNVAQQTQGFALIITGDVDDQTEIPCPGDLNGDLLVNFEDLNLLLDNYNTAGPIGDINEDGTVDFEDLNMLLDLYNADCTDRTVTRIPGSPETGPAIIGG